MSSFIIWLGLILSISQHCPKGKIASGGWATSGCNYVAGCRTLEDAKKANEWFAKCSCGEAGFGSFGVDKKGLRIGEGHNSEWADGKCKTTYWRYVNGVEKKMSSEEYYCTGNWETYKEVEGKFKSIKIADQPECSKYKESKK